MRWKILVAMVSAVIVAVFTVLNSAKVQINFLFVTAQIHLVFVILLSMLLGMVFMAALWSARAVQWRKDAKSLRKELAELAAELEKYRMNSAKDETTETTSPDDINTNTHTNPTTTDNPPN